MPAAFDACVSAGGRVRTISGPDRHFGLSKGEYVHVCILRGKLVRGYVKQKRGDAAPSEGAVDTSK